VAEQSAMSIPHITNAEKLRKRIFQFALLKDYTAQLMQAGLRVYEIKRSKVDDRNYDGIRVTTMHRVKCLEFSYMFVAAVNKRIVPLASAINRTDAPAKAESITAEKCLLYVVLTRA